jgi:CHAD domain-containing protein
MPVSPRRYELLQKRLRAFTEMLHSLREGDRRALHQTRVASRRLREILPVLQIHHDLSAGLERRLRKVTDRLGPLRDQDVLLGLLEQLAESERYSASAVKAIEITVVQRRRQLRDRLGVKNLTVETARIAKKINRVARQLESRDERTTPSEPSARGWQWAIEARVARRASRLKDAVDRAGAVYLPERLHAVRIALKKLRYAAELGHESAGKGKTSQLRALKRYQDLLGRLHDFQVLVETVREMQASQPLDNASTRDLDSLVLALENDCRQLHGRYVRQRSSIVSICDGFGDAMKAANGPKPATQLQSRRAVS